jgi:hypothetical protein
MPDFAKCLAMRITRGLDLDPLEAVLAAVIARVSACDSLCALLRNVRQLSRRSISAARAVEDCQARSSVPDSQRA